MDKRLYQGISTEEHSADTIVNDQITVKGNEINAKLNKTLNDYRAALIAEMEEQLSGKRKELEKTYPDDPITIEKEMKKLSEPLMKIIEQKCQIRYAEELKIAKEKMDEHLDQRTNEIHSALKGMLANPVGSFESILQNLIGVAIADIEDRLKNIQTELGDPMGDIVTTRAERNGCFDDIFKLSTKSDPTSVNPEAIAKQLPSNLPESIIGGGFGGGIKKQDAWQIDDVIRDQALNKVNFMKSESIDKLRQKISQKIHCVTGIRIEGMIGSDIKWQR